MLKNPNIVAGGLGLVVAVGAWTIAASFHNPMAGSDLGPSLFPQLVSIGLGLVSLSLIITGWHSHHLLKSEPISGLGWLKLAVFLAFILGYVLCINWLGYFVSTFIFCIGFALIGFWTIDAKKMGYASLTALIVCAVIYVIFRLMFKFTLPHGLFF